MKTVSKEEIEFYGSIGYNCLRYIEGKGLCGLSNFMFTIGLVYGIDKVGYVGRYCYPHEFLKEALVALADWDGNEDPTGPWIKHKGNGIDKLNKNKDYEITG